MKYREAIDDIEADQERRQELDGSASSCSTFLNSVALSTTRQRSDVGWTMKADVSLSLSWPWSLHNEASDAGSFPSNCYLWSETNDEPLKRGIEVYPKSERLSGPLHCDTQPVLRCSAATAIWIKNQSSLMIWKALKAQHGWHRAVVAFWIKNNSLVISQTALKTLHAWFLSGDEPLGATRQQHRRLDEFSDLINICRALINTCRLKEHEIIDKTMRKTLTRNRLLHRHTKEMVLDFQGKARILLSLLAWHFDPKMASVSHGLLRFFDHPHAQLDAVCTNIYPIYSKLHEVENEERLWKDLDRLIKLLRWAVSEPWGFY